MLLHLDFLYECNFLKIIWYNGLNELTERQLYMKKDEISKIIEQISDDFIASSKLLTAIGDDTRQHLILQMIKIGNCSGVRVGEITAKTNLSRPAVSHHLRILKESGIVKVRKEGTKNYYYFDPEMKPLEKLVEALQLTIAISKALPDRSGENE